VISWFFKPLLSNGSTRTALHRGVSFATCGSSSTLDSLRHSTTLGERGGAIHGPNNLTPPEFLTPMDAIRVEQGGGPLMAVKLTRLSDGGCVLGVSWSHLVADGSAMNAFISAWTVGGFS
jgi:hypothetical protein